MAKLEKGGEAAAGGGFVSCSGCEKGKRRKGEEGSIEKLSECGQQRTKHTHTHRQTHRHTDRQTANKEQASAKRQKRIVKTFLPFTHTHTHTHLLCRLGAEDVTECNLGAARQGNIAEELWI